MIRFRLLAVAAALCLCVPAGVAPAQPGPPDPAILSEARVVFPERLGNMVRRDISSVAPGYVGATYVLADRRPGAPLADIFVRRVAEPLAEEFANNEAMIARLSRNMTSVRDLPAPRGAPGALGRLWRAEWEGGPVLTGTMIWHRDGWRIKIRGTVAADRGEAGWGEIQRLIDAFDWDGTP